jgi:hypothetical protein
MAVMLIARFDGDVERLTAAYDEAHRLIMESGGPPGELRHHCATGNGALFIIGVWESEEVLRDRIEGTTLEAILTSAGFPSFRTADITILQLHATEPPLGNE